MRNILFLSYYWPPSGKAALHWPLKMIQYLPSLGWQPAVITVEEDSFSEKDNSLLKDIPDNLKIIKTPQFDVFKIYRKITGRKLGEPLSISETVSNKNNSPAQKLSLWMRMNIFIPDARIGWYSYGVKAAIKLIREYESEGKKIDMIFSLGTPHSTHLIAKKVSHISKIPYTAFLSDPWVDQAYYKSFNRSALSIKIDRILESSVMKTASKIIFVTQTARQSFIERYPEIEAKSYVLFWGYDESKFRSYNPKKHSSSDEKFILHTGNMADFQNPEAFWQLIKSKNEKGANYKIHFTGTVGPAVINSLERAGLKDYYKIKGFLQYNDLIKEFDEADILLVCPYDKNHIPGKLFEYLRAGKPIIAFCDDNPEVASILNNSGAGMLFSFSESGSEFFDKKFEPDLTEAQKYERKNIATQLSEILLTQIKTTER